MLEASIALDELPDLPRRERACRARRRPTRASAHRARELRDRPGWAWLRPFRRLDEYERALAELERAERERRAERRETSSPDARAWSPGRMNWISGTMHAREVRSRKRTASAMSSGWIISSRPTPSTQSVIAVSTNPGQKAVTWTPSLDSSLCSAWLSPTTPNFVAE